MRSWEGWQRLLRTGVLWRLFWALMVVGHGPAALSAWIDVALGEHAVARAVVLTFSLAFFALKVADVPWLRVRADRRTLVAIIVVIVLLHAGLLDPGVREEFALPEVWQAVFIGGTLAALAAVLVRNLRGIDGVSRRALRNRARKRFELVRARSTTALLPPRFQFLLRRISVNRAPPVCPA